MNLWKGCDMAQEFTARKRIGGGRRIVRKSSISQEDADEKLALALLHQPKLKKPLPEAYAGTFADFYLTVYVPHVWPDLRPRSREKYKTLFNKHIIPALGHLPLARIGLEDLQRLRLTAQRVDRQKEPGTPLKPLSEAHVREIVLRTKEVLKLALRLGRTQRDDWAVARAPKRPHKKDRHEPEPDFVERLMGAAAGTFMELPVWLALVLGLRRGEICGLRWSDVDPKRRTLRIEHQRQPRVGLTGTKTDPRTIPLPPQVLRELDTRGDKDSAFLCTDRSRPVHPDKLSKAMPALCRRAGVKPVGLHDLRSFCASNLFALGADPAAVQGILGHRRLETTELYVYGRAEAQRDAIRRALGGE